MTTARAGARAELGLPLTRFLAVSGGAAYQDGTGSISNAGTANHFAGYAADTRALVHLIYAPVVISGGLAEYESFENATGLYRQRAAVSYKPVMATVNWGPAYARYEQTLNARGSMSRTYSDQGGGRGDLKFDLPKARLRALELGLFLPSVRYATHVFVNYARWTFDAPAALSDGVASVGPGRMVTTTLTAGLGLAF